MLEGCFDTVTGIRPRNTWRVRIFSRALNPVLTDAMLLTAEGDTSQLRRKRRALLSHSYLAGAFRLHARDNGMTGTRQETSDSESLMCWFHSQEDSYGMSFCVNCYVFFRCRPFKG
jgi:hypothetical protein